MEPICRASYSVDETWRKEVYAFIYWRRPRARVLWILSVVMFGVFLPFVIWGYLVGVYQQPGAEIVLLFLWLYLAFLPLIRYTVALRRTRKRDSELHVVTYPMTLTVELTETALSQYDSEHRPLTVEFGDIRIVYVTDASLVLVTRAGSVIFITRPAAYEIGNEETFLAHLRAKGVKIRNE
ncbi:MAG: hypothetical protein J6X61_04320 [Clostridia bacterium]|nr:hypothetical protein [Clostridia bacterium]